LVTKGIYFILAIGLFLLSGCAKKDKASADITETYTIRKQVNIKKLKSKKLTESLAIEFLPFHYQNTTTHIKSIGELLNNQFEEVVSIEKDIEIASKPGHFIGYKLEEYPDLRKTNWMVRLFLDNDIFSNTDYYYTNGFKIELIVPGLNKSPINKIFPAFKNSDIEFCGFSITQNIYTPTNPDTRVILLGDRPFAAFLTIGQFRETWHLPKAVYFKSELKLGVVGPSSLGQQVQTSIHEIEPVGWQNQINNDIVIDYQILFKKGLYNSSLIDLNIIANGNIGTIFNKFGGGIDLRFGHFTPFYSGPLSFIEYVNPAGHLQYWIFFKAKGNLVAYDATMQGGIFNKENPYTLAANDLNRFVLDASIGIALYYNNIGIEYEHYYLSPEFKGARHFGWGSIKASLAF